jgi:uncharacterized protein (DUF58 family)
MAGPSLIRPPGRQGPGRMPPAAVEALDLVVARRAAGALPGDRRAAGIGAGTELAQLRPYQIGDDVRQIDASATARTGIPHVRLQVPERVLTTWLVLDLSPSMAFGTANRLKSDVAEGVALVMARLGARRGGRVALVTCGAAVSRMIPPRGGRGAIAPIQRALREGVSADGHDAPHALADALMKTGRIAQQAGFVVVISDFRGPQTWVRPLGALRARHSVQAVEVRDPREMDLPAVGHLSLVDPETGALVEVDSSRPALRRRFAEAAQQEREEIAAELRGLRVDHVVLSTDGDWLRDLGRTMT